MTPEKVKPKCAGCGAVVRRPDAARAAECPRCGYYGHPEGTE